ncbi:hypothetical protein TWF481_007171 [Arthrobotrys musiformis]|uniref:Uncharacterized protein n=1 Tax=Arthrobotrys musiformis TaxID=47236 RepID=A0AAV9WAR7_9PEZI
MEVAKHGAMAPVTVAFEIDGEPGLKTRYFDSKFSNRNNSAYGYATVGQSWFVGLDSASAIIK